jgi:hypothetical protein
MAVTKAQDEFTRRHEFVLDEDGKKHYIFPMKIRDKDIVRELFSKIDDVYVINNFPETLKDEYGKPVLTEDGQEVVDDEAWISMWLLLEMALSDIQENIEKWIDVKQMSEVLAAYCDASGLKKKLEMQLGILTGPNSTPE